MREKSWVELPVPLPPRLISMGEFRSEKAATVVRFNQPGPFSPCRRLLLSVFCGSPVSSVVEHQVYTLATAVRFDHGVRRISSVAERGFGKAET
jgi:hypothetical protein